MRVVAVVAVAGSVLVAACRAAPPSRTVDASAATASAPDLARDLPETLGAFHGGALTVGDAWIRRVYTRGPVAIDVTIAGHPEPSQTDAVARWRAMGEGYPQVAIAGASDAVAGFYDCNGAPPDDHCAAHLQTKNNLHVEIMGGARRADIDAIVASLPWAQLAQEK